MVRLFTCEKFSTKKKGEESVKPKLGLVINNKKAAISYHK